MSRNCLVVACLDILRILTLVEGIAAESVLKSFDSEYISQAPFTCSEVKENIMGKSPVQAKITNQ